MAARGTRRRHSLVSAYSVFLRVGQNVPPRITGGGEQEGVKTFLSFRSITVLRKVQKMFTHPTFDMLAKIR